MVVCPTGSRTSRRFVILTAISVFSMPFTCPIRQESPVLSSEGRHFVFRVTIGLYGSSSFLSTTSVSGQKAIVS